MFKVYQQLNELKKRTDEQEVKMKRDEQLNKLQTALEWFREEAVKLGETCQFYKKECDKWKAKADSLEDDRKFLEFQLKAAKKQIKDLSSREPLHSSQSQEVSLPPLPPKVELPNTTSAHFLLQLAQKVSPQDPQYLAEVERFMSSQEQKFNEAIRHVQNTLETERKRTKSANAMKSSAFLEKSELEGLFLECVDEVRKEVMRRRAKSIMKTKYPLKSQSAAKDRKENFTPSDKRKILELLIANEQVLVFLYEKLFPYRANLYTSPQAPPKPTVDLQDLTDLAQMGAEMSRRNEATPVPPEVQRSQEGFSHRGRVLLDKDSH